MKHSLRGAGFTKDLTIDVKEIGKKAFEGYSNFTGNLTIGNSVQTIGDSAFAGCTGFTGNLIIPNNVQSLGNTAFGGCT